MAALAELHQGEGRFEAAEQAAREALAMQPAHAEALAVMGYVFLGRGDTSAARDQAVWILSNDPSDEGGLQLMAAVKARQNPILGLWWRLNTRLNSLGQTGTVVALLGAYLAFRIATQAASDLGEEELSSLILIAWLAICGLTWFAPTIFRRMVKKELSAVELSPDF